MSADEVKQFNVYLPVELIKRVKHHAVESGRSLSSIVTESLAAYLDQSGQLRSMLGPPVFIAGGHTSEQA